MSLQMMHSFRGYEAPDWVLEGVRAGTISSFCLFAYNVESPAQLRSLTESLYAAAREGGQPPPLIGIDQEGGQLQAIMAGATELPGNMALGAARSPELAEEIGRLLGRELLAMGVNLNFAPVLDVNNNADNPMIGIRSFGASPELVADLGAALIRGMQSEGVAATAKHFPGHGDTTADSHFEIPTVSQPLERLQAVELLPFRRAIEAGVKAAMSGHAMYPALDKDNPATLSSIILGGLLRDELGFDGILMTDAMDMHAVAQFGPETSVAAALRAGADLTLLGHLPDQPGISAKVEALTNPVSVERIQRLRETLPRELPPLSVVNSVEHQATARKAAEAAITLVKNSGGQLPLSLNADQQVVVITFEPENLTPADTSKGVQIRLADAVRERHANTQAIFLPMYAGTDAVTAALESALSADVVIVGTIAGERDEAQSGLVRALVDGGTMPIVVSLRTPYDLIAFPMIETYLCAYGVRKVSTDAAVRVLFGEIEAGGVLPCPLPGIENLPAGR